MPLLPGMYLSRILPHPSSPMMSYFHQGGFVLIWKHLSLLLPLHCLDPYLCSWWWSYHTGYQPTFYTIHHDEKSYCMNYPSRYVRDRPTSQYRYTGSNVQKTLCHHRLSKYAQMSGYNSSFEILDYHPFWNCSSGSRCLVQFYAIQYPMPLLSYLKTSKFSYRNCIESQVWPN